MPKNESSSWLGPSVWLYRKFRSDKVTREMLPYFIALTKILLVASDEPEVARAKIVYFGEVAPWEAV